MPLVLLAALAGSLSLHLVALFGPEIDLSPAESLPVPLQVSLPSPQTMRVAPLAERKAKSLSRHKGKQASTVDPRKTADLPLPPVLVSAPQETPTPEMPPPTPTPVADSESQKLASLPSPESSALQAVPAVSIWPAEGRIRYQIVTAPAGFLIGRAEQRWQFNEAGEYRLQSTTETSGVVAWFKPVHIEQESQGRWDADGLHPLRFRTRKNGADANENADFDPSTVSVRLSREATSRTVSPGTQDALSLYFHLAYLGDWTAGQRLGLVTGKKYADYLLEFLGEESIDVPAGRYRTLHVRVGTDNILELWLALDVHNLPVKLRFTDRKGEAFEQLASELDMP